MALEDIHIYLHIWYINLILLFKKNNIYLFIFGYAGHLLLPTGFL